MKNKKKYFYLIFLTGLLIMFSGCRTTRKATSVSLNKMSKEDRIESIKQQAIPFNTISSSMRFSIKPGMKKSNTTIPAQLRIIKDEIIQLSLRAPFINTEVARLTITPEQIIFLDRSNRRYASESIQTFKEMASFDFDFYSLQALFTNQLFIAGKSSISSNDYNTFNLNEDNFYTKLKNTDNQGINYDFISDYTNRILQTEMYNDNKEVNINWQYKDFGLASNNRLFPMKMTMDLTVPDDLITLNLNLNSLDIDTDFRIDTSIPDRFQKITIEQIILLIQSL